MKDFPAYGKGNTGRLVRNAQAPSAMVSARILILMIILLGVALFFVAQRTEFIRTERRIKALMQEKRQIREEILPYKLEAEYLSRLERVQEIALGRLQMIEPPAFRVVTPPKPVVPDEPKELEEEPEEITASPEAPPEAHQPLPTPNP